MSTKRVTYRASVKAIPDANGNDIGQVEAIVSVFNNVDLQGDRVLPGAFTKSIAAWRASGDPIPVVFSHEWDDLWSHIGVVTDISETPVGLRAVYMLDIDDNPAAAQVYKLLKRRSLKEHSFAYEIMQEQRAKDGANDLIELGIIEIGPTLKGANPDTELLTVKRAVLGMDARKERTVTRAGRKVWMDIESEGSLNDLLDDINDAAQTAFNPTDDDSMWVSVQVVYPTYAIVEVQKEGEEEQNFRVPWTTGADGDPVLGDPEPVELTVTIAAAPKSALRLARARRGSKATDADEDPGRLAQAIDAAIDGALKCLDPTDDDYNIDQAVALLGAAEVASDALLELLGVPDADDVDAKSLAMKAGRRLSAATEAQMKAIRDHMMQGVNMLDTCIGTATEDDGGKSGSKGATSFADLPIDKDRQGAWDSGAAGGRVRAWASSDGSGDTDKIDFTKFARAFFWVDSSARDQIGSYKLPFADVVSGTLTAIPRGVFGCAAAIQGSRGGVAIPDGDIAAVKNQIEKYYAKMRTAFDDDSIVAPWASSASAPDGAATKSSGTTEPLRAQFHDDDTLRLLTRVEEACATRRT